MGEISEAFPEAKCYAPAPVVTLYAHQYQPKLDEWTETIGEQNLCRKQCDKRNNDNTNTNCNTHSFSPF